MSERASISLDQRAVGDVEEQRARGVGDVGGEVAGEAEADVVLRQEHRADAGPELGFVAPHPEQLGQREAGERGVARQLDQAGRARPCSVIASHSAPVR